MSIKIDKVTKFYGTNKALDNISFEVSTGQVVGFIGPNGAGKTTLMRIMTGYLKPSSGYVYINGINVQEQTLKARKLIGYLPETNPLYYEMTVVDFLSFVAGIYDIKNRTQAIEKTIADTGLEPVKHKKIAHLSKGYKQRVGLAQAIIHNPQVLILDEPTSGLDPNQIVEIRNLIKQLGKEKTVILSTHIMQEVEAICDRIIIINNGKIVANDTPETIQQRVDEQMLKFLVEFDAAVNREDLEKIPGVEEVHYLQHGRWLILSFQDIRKQIFNFAVKQNISVLTMDIKRKTLEEIFRELTSDKNS